MGWGKQFIHGAALIASGLLGLSACATSDDDAAWDEGVVVGTVSDALSSGTLKWLNGTYTNCAGRSGSWSARVSGSATMDNAALTVSKNDSACQLNLTAFVADQTYTADTPIALSGSYAGSPSNFGGGASQFKGNAKLDTTGFGANFSITVVYGDTPVAVTSSVTGVYVIDQSSVVASLVAPPNYTLNINDVRFTTDVLQLVLTLTGNAILTNVSVTGSIYAIDQGLLPDTPTYAQTAAAFDFASSSQKAITVVNQAIPSSEFNVTALSILGTNVVRNVIVKRIVAGIAAYQILRVTFVA